MSLVWVEVVSMLRGPWSELISPALWGFLLGVLSGGVWFRLIMVFGSFCGMLGMLGIRVVSEKGVVCLIC